jgi:hypothetical protein
MEVSNKFEYISGFTSMNIDYLQNIDTYSFDHRENKIKNPLNAFLKVIELGFDVSHIL